MKPDFAKQWLNVLCQAIPETHSAIFMMPDAEGKNVHPLAKWPENLNDIADFTPIIKYALKKTNPFVSPM